VYKEEALKSIFLANEFKLHAPWHKITSTPSFQCLPYQIKDRSHLPVIAIPTSSGEVPPCGIPTYKMVLTGQS
jgi:hypothetical protein